MKDVEAGYVWSHFSGRTRLTPRVEIRRLPQPIGGESSRQQESAFGFQKALILLRRAAPEIRPSDGSLASPGPMDVETRPLASATGYVLLLENREVRPKERDGLQGIRVATSP